MRDNLPANPYELPPLQEGDGYTKNATRWSGGMALGPRPEDREAEATHSHRIVAEDAGARRQSCTAVTAYRMRYRRKAGRAPV